jgi:hypothetical protein
MAPHRQGQQRGHGQRAAGNPARNERRPIPSRLPARVRFVRFSGAMLSYGVITRPILGVQVRVTTAARTVVDCFPVSQQAWRDPGHERARHPAQRHAGRLERLWGDGRPHPAGNRADPRFDTMGTVVAVGGRAGFLDEQGRLPSVGRVLLIGLPGRALRRGRQRQQQHDLHRARGRSLRGRKDRADRRDGGSVVPARHVVCAAGQRHEPRGEAPAT